VGLDITMLVTAALAGVLTVGLWFTTPSQRDQPRPRWTSAKDLLVAMFVKPVLSLRDRVVLAVNAFYGFTGMILAFFDGLWPRAWENAHAPSLLIVLLNYGLLGGDVFIVAMSFLGDRASRRGGSEIDFLEAKPLKFLAGLVSTMAFGAL